MRSLLALALICTLTAASPLTADPKTLPRNQVIAETMKPYAGPATRPAGAVDPSTMHGKVLCGYQGWFAAEGDGLGRGWYHWAWHNGFKPGSTKVDMWPDVSDLDPDERYATSFRHADGRPAEVFSAFNRKTVLRHFQWMRDYGIDGAFVQRFIVETLDTKGLRQWNTVLSHCRDGANLHGRTYAVMYDLSGLGANQIDRVIDDWKLLVDRMRITADPAYLRHNGKPVISIWGFGFNDGRAYTLDEGLRLVRFLKDDPTYGGCTVILGIPGYWREVKFDSVADPKLHDLLLAADVISPWTVGRYPTIEKANAFAKNVVAGDLAWCKQHDKEYLPVVFPGFSWQNMNPKSKLDEIPRLKGRFLWTQYLNLRRLDCDMVYQAMFDEVDEATAIFKVTNDPPVGPSRFVTYEGLPSDFYLRLVGEAGRMIRGEIPPDISVPERLAKEAAQ